MGTTGRTACHGLSGSAIALCNFITGCTQTFRQASTMGRIGVHFAAYGIQTLEKQ